ncbi:acyl-CoA thioesterase [Paracoccus jeotgali]|uniref:Thioeseterase n=1 Tax=Paracoccus jeotgali TaxID=2065379 RepID=A0A2K9MK34_9RHOB|nr:thioesterase family protein [Paracoccus jeotgali]AUM75406.1 thioeseterase [Paracoccus jeotgali]
MYPLIRFAKEMIKFRRAPRLAPLGTHVSDHICWPWDLDPWIELNNGRTLTLFDLGRIPMASRMGLIGQLRAQGWGITVAGSSVRYRRRVRAFQRFRMTSRVIGWDARFVYIEQAMWRGTDCCNHALLRTAVTSAEGIVPPQRVLDLLQASHQPPPLPDWVEAWIAAEQTRPWPPELPPDAQAALTR